MPPGLTLSAAGLLSGTPTTSGSFDVTVEGEDGNGFIAQRAYTLVVAVPDTTAPVITPTVTGTLGNDGWYVGDVTVSWSVADAESAIATSIGCNTVTLSTDTPGASFTCTATSAGGTSTETVTIKRDATAPMVTAAPASGANENGWHTVAVTLGYTCDDATSGVATCPVDEVIAHNGNAVATPARTATDVAGNTGASQPLTLAIDTVAPNTTLAQAPPAQSDSATATFAFNGSDATSGIAGFECSLDGVAFAACASPVNLGGIADGAHTFTVRAKDMAGHADGTPATHTWTIDTDTTAPVITPTVTGPLGNDGWYVGDVTVSWSVADAESAIAASTGCNTVTLSTDTPGASFTCTATSAGGNGTQTVTFKLDKTAPQLAPQLAGPLLLNATATAQAHASDALSGVAAQGCTALATATTGSKATTCSATDAAGNTASTGLDYRVVYGFAGFEGAVQATGWNQAAMKRAVPFAWRVVDAQGAGVTTLANATIVRTPVKCPLRVSGVPLSAYAGNVSGPLQNLGDGHYQRNWVPPMTARGTCARMRVDLGDGELHEALFYFR